MSMFNSYVRLPEGNLSTFKPSTCASMDLLQGETGSIVTLWMSIHPKYCFFSWFWAPHLTYENHAYFEMNL